jgi:Regulator of chromosome condensation (RCC1) repeat
MTSRAPSAARPLSMAAIALVAACQRPPERAPPNPAPRAAPPPASIASSSPTAPLPVASSPPAPEAPAAAPVPPPEDHRIAQLAVGADSTCVRTEGREVWCWGQNQRGQLGDGTKVDRPTPARVPLDGVVEIGAGDYDVCARLAGGTVWCWGFVMEGSGATAGRDYAVVHPTEVVGVRDARRLVVGEGSACAFTGGGDVLCWGLAFPFHGAAWTGVAPVPELRAAVRAGIGFSFVCYQEQEEGAVLCWSDTPAYHLTGRPRETRTKGPVTVEGLPPARGLAAGGLYPCAITQGGEVYCWGPAPEVVFGPYELLRPTRLPGLSDVTRLALSTVFLCVAHADGGVHCMGSNKRGELGDGSTRTTAYPRKVLGIDDAVDVAAGQSHACAVTRRGTLLCWGANDLGQLGDGTRVDRPRPVEVRF